MSRTFETSVSLKNHQGLTGLESMKGAYKAHEFKPHYHDEYLFGLIEQGAHEVSCRGCSVVADAGTVVIMNPGDVHFGKSACKEGWTQRFIYISENLMVEAMNDVLGTMTDKAPIFDQVFQKSPEISQSLASFHEVLHGSTFSLTRDVALDAIMNLLFKAMCNNMQHAKACAAMPSKRMRSVLDYIHEHVCEDIRIDDLCKIAGVRRRQLIENFKEATGLPPHAYHIILKTKEVKRLLREGSSAVEASTAAGFADQSHMSRHFLPVVGMTPAKYAASSR